MSTQANSALPYDPLAAQPLDSGSAAGADSAAAAGPQLPPITAPPKAPDIDTPSAGSGPRLLPGAKGTRLGVIAYLGESMLKGITKGREQYQAQQAYKAKRLSDGLQYAYQTAADNYTSLIKSGADPNSPDVQKADLAQRAAYQSLMQMRGNFIFGQDGGGGKSKSKKKYQDATEDPMQMFMSNDPQTKMKGAFLLQQKMFQTVGTPANANARQYLTPEFQAQRKLMQGEQRLSQGNVEDKLQLRNLEMTDTSKMTPEQKNAHEQQVQGLRDRISEAASGYSQKEKIIDKKTTSDNHQWVLWQDAGGKTRWEDQGEQRGLASTIAKPGSEQAFIESVAKEHGIDAKNLSAQSQLDLRHAWLQSAQMGKVVGQNYIYTDKETGQIVVVPLTKTTSAAPATVPSVSATGGAPASATAAPNATSTSTTPTAPTGHPAAKPKAGVRDLPAPGTKPTDASAASTPPPGSPPGAHVIGHTLSQPQAKSQATTTDTYKKMKPLFGLLSAQEDYMKEVQADPGKATPRQDLSLVVAAVRAMNPGSVRLPQKELELEMQAGSWGDQARRWYEKASTGLLPEDQRKDLFGIVQRETTKAGESIAADWQQYMSGQPLPNDIKRFAKGGGGGAGAGGSGTDTAVHPELKNKMDADFGLPKT